MRNKKSFREPLGQDLNGLYITTAQMQFFLNRPKGGLKFINGSQEFFKYFYKCAVYNIIWDLLDKDPKCASFYWNEEEEAIAVKFPKKGKVVDELKRKKVNCFQDEDY
tara:strand:+ start:631 stop:954 length:324 start_codon:yes stop_codon:yes gene_type:complete